MSNLEKSTNSDGYDLTQLGPKQRQIPILWGVRKLGTIASINMGSSPKSKYYNEQGDGLPFFQGNADFGGHPPQVTVWCTNPDKTADEGDLLLSVRAPVGDLNIADHYCCIGRGLVAISGKEANNSFLYHLLSFERPRLESYAQGSTFRSINSGVLHNFPVQFPPLPEQRRIAEILSTVDELIQQTDAIIEAKQHLTQGFINVLVKTGVQDSPDTNKVQIGPKQVKIPTNWDLLRVDELVTDDDDAIRTGPFGSKLKKEYFVSEGVKVYEQSNVYNKDFTQGNRFVTQDRYESELTSYDANPGDVLITLQGTIGDAAVLPDNAEPGVINQKLMRVQVDSELCLPEYFATFFDESRLADFQIEAVSHGAVVSGLNISTISGIRVPIPSLQEQQRIIDVVESSKSSLDEEQETKQNLQELKRGLMQDLLTGEVRVPVET
jgi:type I restriction enzyme S subunit